VEQRRINGGDSEEQAPFGLDGFAYCLNFGDLVTLLSGMLRYAPKRIF